MITIFSVGTVPEGTVGRSDEADQSAVLCLLDRRRYHARRVLELLRTEELGAVELTAASSSHGSPVGTSQQEFRPPHRAGQAIVLAWSLVLDYARTVWRRCG